MCGGDIQAAEGAAYGTCGSCGTTSTLPKASDDRVANLFNRANHFRRQNEFDKAAQAYENILNEDNADAEAYWGLALSRYGIEYVEDPRTRERVPTCHRMQFEPFLSDPDYLAAIDCAGDEYAKSLYADEAKKISEIQRGILAISSREAPYDVFICYKETADGGSRTKDSTLAQDIYYELTNGGYRVFFAKITLEDKLGQEYEPYIFSALNSAKVMLVIGTRKEYFEAVWVKNEWSRYLAVMKKDRSRLLIPCYKDMDAYDIPNELSNLQSQDMSKIGFMQDILRGVKKILDAGKQAGKAPVPAAAAVAAGDSIGRLIKNGDTLLKLNNRAGAREAFNYAAKEYPEDYRGWLGLARCATANFTAPPDDWASLNMWLGYVKQLAQRDEFAALEKELVEYMKKTAVSDAENDAAAVNNAVSEIRATQIPGLVKQRGQVEAEREARKLEHKRKMAGYKETVSELEGKIAELKQKHTMNMTRVIVGIVTFGLVIGGLFLGLPLGCMIGAGEIFSSGGASNGVGVMIIGVLIESLVAGGLFGVPLLIVSAIARKNNKDSKSNFYRFKDAIPAIEEQRDEVLTVIKAEKESDKLAIAAFEKPTYDINIEIWRAETRIAYCQKYLGIDKRKIAGMFFAQRCESIGIRQQYDEAIMELRNIVLNPDYQFDELLKETN
jgi:tetratricopeptide (TPR) repeat protein